jgi:hypothetical protein
MVKVTKKFPQNPIENFKTTKKEAANSLGRKFILLNREFPHECVAIKLASILALTAILHHGFKVPGGSALSIATLVVLPTWALAYTAAYLKIMRNN